MNNNRSDAANSNQKLGWVERIGYGFGGIGTDMILVIISTYVVIYMTNVALLDIAVISTLIAVSKAFDGVSDLIAGHILDHTSTPLGKARPWLLTMCFPLALASWFLFRVPAGWPVFAKYVYVFVFYNLACTICFTFLQVAHFSLTALITKDKEEQGLLGVLQSVFTNVGRILGTSLFVKILFLFSNDVKNQNTQPAYSGAMAVYGLAMILTILITVITTRERVTGIILSEDRPGASARGGLRNLDGVKALLSDKNWLIMIGGQTLCFIGAQLLMLGGSYYALYILKDMGQMAWLTATVMVASLVVKFVIPFMLKKWSKTTIFIMGNALILLGCIGFGIFSWLKPMMIVSNIIRGCGIGISNGIQLGLIADMVRATDRKKGVYAAGLGNAGVSAANKFGTGIGGVLFGFAMSAAGFSAAYDAQGIAQPAAVNHMISWMYIWGPMVLYALVVAVFLLFFKLEE